VWNGASLVEPTRAQKLAYCRCAAHSMGSISKARSSRPTGHPPSETIFYVSVPHRIGFWQHLQKANVLIGLVTCASLWCTRFALWGVYINHSRVLICFPSQTQQSRYSTSTINPSYPVPPVPHRPEQVKRHPPPRA
jgi:hypothetical protein